MAGVPLVSLGLTVANAILFKWTVLKSASMFGLLMVPGIILMARSAIPIRVYTKLSKYNDAEAYIFAEIVLKVVLRSTIVKQGYSDVLIKHMVDSGKICRVIRTMDRTMVIENK